LIGALGAVAAETATLPAWVLGASKHDASADQERQTPKDGAAAPLVCAITPKPLGLRAAAAGAIGAAQPISTNVVTIEPMKPNSTRIAILLAIGLHGG
jgi:hypothetical protein